MRLFHGCIETTEKREKDPIFQPNLSIETNPEEREKVLKLVSKLDIRDNKEYFIR